MHMHFFFPETFRRASANPARTQMFLERKGYWIFLDTKGSDSGLLSLKSCFLWLKKAFTLWSPICELSEQSSWLTSSLLINIDFQQTKDEVLIAVSVWQFVLSAFDPSPNWFKLLDDRILVQIDSRREWEHGLVNVACEVLHISVRTVLVTLNSRASFTSPFNCLHMNKKHTHNLQVLLSQST